MLLGSPCAALLCALVLAALAPTHALAQPQVADGAKKIHVVAGDETLRKAIDDALVDAKVVPASLAVDMQAGSLLLDDAAAAARAKALHEEGKADWLVVGDIAFQDERKTEMSSSVRTEATIIVVSGRSGQRLTKILRAEKGAAADMERARRKSSEAAGKAAARALAEEIVGIMARPQELSITVEVRGMTPDARDRVGDRLEKALAQAGMTLGARRLDVATGVWKIECRTTAGTQDQVERTLRKSLREAGLLDWLTLVEAPPGGFVYSFQDPTRDVFVVVEGMDDETQRVAGTEIADALAKLPAVAKVDRAFDAAQKAIVFTLSTSARLSDLDASLVAAREGPLGALKLVRMAEALDRQEVRYRLVKAVAPYVVEIHAIESRNVANVGVKIDEALKTIKGYVSHERKQDPAQGMVTLTITFQGRPWELERRLLDALSPVPELPQLMAIVPGKGSDLAYRAAMSLNVAIRVRVTQVTPEIYRQSGLRLVDLVAAIEGVRFIDRKYMPEQELIELAVEGSLDPIDLDMRIWRAIKGVPELLKLAPGETSSAALGYTFLSTTPEDWGATIVVTGIAAEAYAADGRLLVDVIRGMAGVKKVEANYEKDARELTIALRYGRPAHDLEEALWKALEGRTFSKAFSPDRRVGSVIRIAFVERRGDRSRVFIRCAGLRDEAAQVAAKRLLERVKGLEGASEVTGEASGDRFEIALWSAKSATQLYDWVAGALREDAALAPLTDAGLEGNVIGVKAGPLSGAPRPAGTTGGGTGVGFSGGRLSDLVAKLTPSVVLIEGRLPSGASWIGTGFFVSTRGHIITNLHVAGSPSAQFQQAAVQLAVKTSDGRVFQAQFVDGNKNVDVALLKIAGEGFPAVEIADSDLVKPGDGVIVIGHPHGLEFSVTTGIVSALDRAQGRIQSSANTNPGNSGGPVFDEQGRVFAIHVAGSIDEVVVGGREITMKRPGINFHIPINQATPLLQIAGAGPRAGGR